MNEGIETEKQDYEPGITPGELAADFLADPQMHAHHHLMCLRDREQYDDDIEELRETIVEQAKEIENLTTKVNHLSALLHDLFNGEALYHVGMNLEY